MFKTPLTAEVFFPEVGAGNFRRWHVAFHLDDLWFQMTLVTKEDGRIRRRGMMAGGVTIFKQLLGEQSPGMRIENVQAVTPGWMNQQGLCVMSPLDTLWVGQSRLGCNAYVLRLKTGKTYVYHADEGEDESDLQNLTQIYPVTAAHSLKVH